MVKPGGSKSFYWHEPVGMVVGGYGGGYAAGASMKEQMYGLGAAVLAWYGFTMYYLNQDKDDDNPPKKDTYYINKFKVDPVAASGSTAAVTGQAGVNFRILVGHIKSSDAVKQPSAQKVQEITSDMAFATLAYIAGAYYARANMKDILAGSVGVLVGGQLGSTMQPTGASA